MSHGRSQSGFTLIELLVVITIVGILAVIALPAFLGHTRRANDARTKADLDTVQNTLQMYWTEFDTYAATPADLIAREGAVANALNLTVAGTTETYRISADSRQGATYVIEKTLAGIERSCTPLGVGGCSTDGAW